MIEKNISYTGPANEVAEIVSGAIRSAYDNLPAKEKGVIKHLAARVVVGRKGVGELSALEAIAKYGMLIEGLKIPSTQEDLERIKSRSWVA